MVGSSVRMQPNPADPFARARDLVERARSLDANGEVPIVLATADEAGNPSVRWLLLKEVDDRGLVFYTNARSRKGRELLARRRAAIAGWWRALGEQLRVEGAVEEVAPEVADAYWASRPYDSRVGAIASLQSEPLESQAVLVERVMAVLQELGGAAPARPAHWTGFRLLPEVFEFWRQGENRLHHREVCRRDAGGAFAWSLLYP